MNTITPGFSSLSANAWFAEAARSPRGESAALAARAEPASLATTSAEQPELRQAFGDFVAKSLFGQLMQGMRNTLGEPAYFHGGQAEKVFQAQLDQQFVDHVAAATRAQVSDPLFALFELQRAG